MRLEGEAETRAYFNGLHQAAWELAAVAVALGTDGATDEALRRGAQDVLAEVGVTVPGGGPAELSPPVRAIIGDQPALLAAEAASDILQVAALVSGRNLWRRPDDPALLSRGQASGQVAEPFKAFVLPTMDGLEALLDGPAPVMLDVGVGIAGLAVAFCRVFPRLRVVGIDVLPRALELARRTVDEAGMADRIELRLQDLSDLQDRDAFCLTWLPTPFITRPVLDASMPALARALVPGGWIAVGHGKLGPDPLQNALTRFRAAAFGGAAMDDDDAQELLRRAGLERVASLQTPQGAPGLTVGRRPISSPT